jgi:hypothetical protein
VRRLLVVALLAAGCGGSGHVRAAAPGTYELNWVERDGPIAIEVRRLIVGEGTWSVDLAVANRSRFTWDIDRPHVLGAARFGLVTTRVGTGRLPFLFADRFTPPLPRRLHPGERWRGTMSGHGLLPRGRYVHVTVGRFRTSEDAPDPTRFSSVTDHALRLP